jgi:hypothetical protein
MSGAAGSALDTRANPIFGINLNLGSDCFACSPKNSRASVFSAVFVLPRVRERVSSNTLIVLGNALVVLVYLLMALVRQRELFLVVAALAGAGWTLSASELWVAAQRAMPSWARGRMNATVIMVSQGAIALGGIVWGFSSQVAGVNVTLVVAAAAMAFSLLLAIPLSINFTTSLSFDRAHLRFVKNFAGLPFFFMEERAACCGR